MHHFIINGGKPLNGSVKISGAKNSALKLLCAALLTEEKITLHNVPELDDITSMVRLLAHLGIKFGTDADAMTLQADNIKDLTAPYDLVKLMRASIIVLGPMLARFGEAKVSLPGGCAIGARPVDLHLKALEQMGASIEIEDGYVIAKCSGENKRLQGAHIKFEKVSVGATENLLMAATLAEGETILENAACEPEISDIANCLVKMGAKIEGTGTSTLTIQGVEKMHGCEHEVIADRIEAGSFIIAAAMTGGKIELENVNKDIFGEVYDKLLEAGINIEENGKNLIASSNKLLATNITTKPFPGFATDMQAQFVALMCLANGESTIKETIFENRFMHVPELQRMGANIAIDGNIAKVTGIENLKPAEVMATDLRASFSLVLAALAAKGQTKINRVYHIDRGYEKVEEKLRALGADIARITE